MQGPIHCPYRRTHILCSSTSFSSGASDFQFVEDVSTRLTGVSAVVDYGRDQI
jgi:hypothetical protein